MVTIRTVAGVFHWVAVRGYPVKDRVAGVGGHPRAIAAPDGLESGPPASGQPA